MSFIKPKGLPALLLSLLAISLPSLAMADELSGGDTAWILTSTVLVLFMTIPGLALFYAGLVRSKNVLGPAVQLGMPLLSSKPLDLRDRDALHTNLMQGFAHFLKFERFDNCRN